MRLDSRKVFAKGGKRVGFGRRASRETAVASHPSQTARRMGHPEIRAHPGASGRTATRKRCTSGALKPFWRCWAIPCMIGSVTFSPNYHKYSILTKRYRGISRLVRLQWLASLTSDEHGHMVDAAGKENRHQSGFPCASPCKGTLRSFGPGDRASLDFLRRHAPRNSPPAL
jgi:hypothetical protein